MDKIRTHFVLNNGFFFRKTLPFMR